ncbi:hypothetical protein KNP414_00604 [Paenibacillus mucilaginosus KNP414]|uniref:Uncharacterized protein n=1 Tax=Paenibacillus mucilaginosus (strain KNP414) TaxID=1036673 RepID=F8FQE7_PAEMK|nr:hypothetical protein KNP414_00604 [Paenibacillus mucilaginosus KNP414]
MWINLWIELKKPIISRKTTNFYVDKVVDRNFIFLDILN